MSQKGGLARGYKPVVGVRAFLAEDQTEGSTTAKSGSVFFPHFAFPLSLSLLLCNAARALIPEVGKKNLHSNCRAVTCTRMQMQSETKSQTMIAAHTHGQNSCGDNTGMKGIISTKKNRNHKNKTLSYAEMTLRRNH